MKTNVPFGRISAFLFALLFSTFITEKLAAKNNFFDDPVDSTAFKFKSGSLISGVDLQINAVYKFSEVIPGVDAFVRIDSLVNGATIALFDNTSTGYDDAFQPRVRSLPGFSNSYAVFRITFTAKDQPLVPVSISNFSATALDIDGHSTLKEYAIIDLGGGTVNYLTSTPEITVSALGTGFIGKNIAGNEFTGVDTTGYPVMFTVTNSDVSTYTLKLGSEISGGGSASTRNYSVYMKKFNYPNQSALPLELFSFNALLNKTKTDLKWTTLWEKNVSHFEIQRSLDGKEYRQIAAVFAAGNSDEKLNYSFSDNDISNISSGIIYYRLKLMDIDGKYSYSPVRVIRIGKQNESVKVMTYPNPVVNEVRITVPSEWQGKEVKYEVYNASGKMVYTARNASASQTEVINMSGLGKGFYVVKVMMGTEAAQQKIIKN